MVHVIRRMEPPSLRVLIEHKRLALLLARLLFRDVRGSRLSNQARSQRGDDPHLTYGEVVPGSFQQLLLSCSALIGSAPPGDRVFYDLGSGTGKAVLTAALGPHGFRCCRGIELIDSLVEVAVSVRRSLEDALGGLTESGEVLGERRTKSLSKAPKRPHDLQTVLNTAQQILADSSMPEGDLANLLCQRLGAKVFRAAVKTSRSFRDWLGSHPELFRTHWVEGKLLVSSVPPHPETGSSKSASETDDIRASVESTPKETLIQFELMSSIAYRHLVATLPLIEFDVGDFLHPGATWYEDADCAYAASLLFSDEIMGQLQMLVERMKPGSVFISLRPLETTGRLLLVSDSFYQMSWQKSRVYIYSVT